jgi:hypothetical protein
MQQEKTGKQEFQELMSGKVLAWSQHELEGGWWVEAVGKLYIVPLHMVIRRLL